MSLAKTIRRILKDGPVTDPRAVLDEIERQVAKSPTKSGPLLKLKVVEDVSARSAQGDAEVCVSINMDDSLTTRQKRLVLETVAKAAVAAINELKGA